MSNNLRKEVQQANEIIARTQNKPKESELIEIQRDREPEKEEPEPDRHYCHTLDGGGSFVYTGQGMGLFPHENTLTRFTEKGTRNDPYTRGPFNTSFPEARSP